MTSKRGQYRNKLCMPKTKLKLVKRNAYCMAIQIFNKLTDKFKELPFNIFRKRMFDYLVENIYYSVDEFMTDCNL